MCVGWLRLVGSLKLQVSFRIYSVLQGSFAKETYNFKKSTTRSHPIGGKDVHINRTHMQNTCSLHRRSESFSQKAHTWNTYVEHIYRTQIGNTYREHKRSESLYIKHTVEHIYTTHIYTTHMQNTHREHIYRTQKIRIKNMQAPSIAGSLFKKGPYFYRALLQESSCLPSHFQVCFLEKEPWFWRALSQNSFGD